METNHPESKDAKRKYPDSILKAYENQVAFFIDQSQEAEKIFFQIDFDKLKKGGPDSEYEFNQFVANLAQMALFLPEKVELKLKELEVGENVLKWFIPLDDIRREIDKINHISQSNVLYLYPTIALRYIYLHLFFKIIDSVFRSFRKTTDRIKSKRNYNLFHDGLFKHFKKRERLKKKNQTFDNKHGEASLEYILLLLKHSLNLSDKESDHIMSQLSQGKTGKIVLNGVMNCICVIDDIEITKAEKYLMVLDLFKLLIKDKIIHTEMEFENSAIQHTNYRKYLVKTLDDYFKSYIRS